MDSTRLKELAGYKVIESGFMPIWDFKLKTTSLEREKLLWQWATAKQMTFKEWQEYLQAHEVAAEEQGERTE